MSKLRLLEKKMALLEQYLFMTTKMINTPIDEMGVLIEQRYALIASTDIINAQLPLEDDDDPALLPMTEKLNALIVSIQDLDKKVSLRLQNAHLETEQQLRQGNQNNKYAAAIKGYLPEDQTGRIMDSKK